MFNVFYVTGREGVLFIIWNYFEKGNYNPQVYLNGSKVFKESENRNGLDKYLRLFCLDDHWMF